MSKRKRGKQADVNPKWSLRKLRKESKGCTACPLHKTGTQTVFGAGSDTAKIFIVGEQPGDQEDLQGLPFVGPAGAILMKALTVAGIVREDVYVTNAVKHFKWTPRGKRRLHQKPNSMELHACKPWLEAELAQVTPQVVVAMGATAATAILGRLPKIIAERGKVIVGVAAAPAVIITWHPSALLRSIDPSDKEKKFKELVHDFKLAAKAAR